MNGSDALLAGALARSVAVGAAFAGTVPLMPRGLEPPAARLALMVVLVALLMQRASSAPERSSILSIALAALTAAALGLAASFVAYVVTAAGATIDGALGAPPFAAVQISSGPVTLAYQLMFACVLLQSGGLTAIIGSLARLEDIQPGLISVHSCVALMSFFMRESITMAGAALFAQALATLFAALLTRVSPQLGGVLFASSISPAAVVLAIVLGSTTLWQHLVNLSHAQASLLQSLAK